MPLLVRSLPGAAVRAILDRTSIDEYDFAMLSAFGSTTFAKNSEDGGIVSTTFFFGVMSREASDADVPPPPADLTDSVPESVAPPDEAAATGPVVAAADNHAAEEEEDDDDEEEEEEEDGAAPLATGAGAADNAQPAAAAVPAPPPDAPAPPDSYNDQWVPLDRAAELLTDPDQLGVLQQAVRVFQLVAKLDRTPLSRPDLKWPAVASVVAASAGASAHDARLPVTVLSGFLGGMSASMCRRAYATNTTC